MTLPFSETINGKQTYFAEKIWACLQDKQDKMCICDTHKFGNPCIDYGDLWTKFDIGDNRSFDKSIFPNSLPKIHTIRRDEYNRWKAGKLIHPVYGNRTKNRVQFAPTFRCTGIQTIKIEWTDLPFANVYIDGKLIDMEVEKKLAINDGFYYTQDFFRWFNSDFKGKIIHWTDFRY